MGVRGRGRNLTKAFCDQPDVNIAYVCDVDQNVVEGAYKIIAESGGNDRPWWRTCAAVWTTSPSTPS